MVLQMNCLSCRHGLKPFHSRKNPLIIIEYQLTEKASPVTEGQAIGSKIATGIARILQSPKDSDKLKAAEIVVTDLTSPDWDPILKNAAAIITNKGGRTSHPYLNTRLIDKCYSS